MGSSFGEIEVRMMRRALALAALGSGTTAPNPLVGAVVARGATVLGEGYHRRPGEPHAEAVALARVPGDTRGATLFTNLEPCCHTGRTPPCVDGILGAGVTRVVAAMRDPNPRVDGGGFRALRKAGVAVEVGLLRNEASWLNEGFIKHIRTGLPLVTLKGAVSLDGRIATRSGDSRWITSEMARRHARLLRLEHEAVLVGIETALADDPRLDRRPRLEGGAPLLRVVLDSRLRLSPKSRLATSRTGGPVLVFCDERAPLERRRRLEGAGVEVETLPEYRGRLDLTTMLRSLGSRGVTRLLVEGGGELHASFLERKLADRLALYLAPRIIGGRDARPLVGGQGSKWVKEASRLARARWAKVGEEWLVEGELTK